MSPQHRPARTQAAASTFVDKHYVCADLHWSESTLWRRIKAGEYPAPVKAGSGPTARNLWLRTSHERYVQRLIEQAQDHRNTAA